MQPGYLYPGINLICLIAGTCTIYNAIPPRAHAHVCRSNPCRDMPWHVLDKPNMTGRWFIPRRFSVARIPRIRGIYRCGAKSPHSAAAPNCHSERSEESPRFAGKQSLVPTHMRVDPIPVGTCHGMSSINQT